MAPTTDYRALRARALGSGNEEAVTVNMENMIDNVLARYMKKWSVRHPRVTRMDDHADRSLIRTLLRELIQNAADASASKVTIRYETRPSSTVRTPESTDPSASIKHVCSHHTLKRLVVTNDGHQFQRSDWTRLKRVAEGNPDETKIGAFGVGFYSVFDVCKEPMVRSGHEILAFYWKDKMLYTQTGLLSPGDFQKYPGGPSG